MHLKCLQKESHFYASMCKEWSEFWWACTELIIGRIGRIPEHLPPLPRYWTLQWTGCQEGYHHLHVTLNHTWFVELNKYNICTYDECIIVHYSDVIMSMMASQITNVSIIYSTVCSGADQRKQAPCHWPLWGEFTDSLHKGPVTWKMFSFDDIIICKQKYRNQTNVESNKETNCDFFFWFLLTNSPLHMAQQRWRDIVNWYYSLKYKIISYTIWPIWYILREMKIIQ